MVSRFPSNKDYELILPNGGKIIYYAKFISEEEASKVFEELKSGKWIQGEYQMFGKPVKTPRLLWAMGIVNKKYVVTQSGDWTPLVSEIRDKIIKESAEKIIKMTKKEINYAQMNYYRNGNDSIGYHNDKETQDGDFIYSLSLGVERKFQLRPIDSTKMTHELILGNGSLLIMDADACKKFYKHQVPKQPKIEGERINVTFRNK